MISLFRALSEARRQRKRLKAALAHNAKRFEDAIEQIDREYQGEADAIMNRFIQDLARIGDIEGEEAEAATAAATHEIDQIKERADRKRADAKKADERRIRQILAFYR